MWIRTDIVSILNRIGSLEIIQEIQNHFLLSKRIKDKKVNILKWAE